MDGQLLQALLGGTAPTGFLTELMDSLDDDALVGVVNNIGDFALLTPCCQLQGAVHWSWPAGGACANAQSLFWRRRVLQVCATAGVQRQQPAGRLKVQML